MQETVGITLRPCNPRPNAQRLFFRKPSNTPSKIDEELDENGHKQGKAPTPSILPAAQKPKPDSSDTLNKLLLVKSVVLILTKFWQSGQNLTEHKYRTIASSKRLIKGLARARSNPRVRSHDVCLQIPEISVAKNRQRKKQQFLLASSPSVPSTRRAQPQQSPTPLLKTDTKWY